MTLFYAVCSQSNTTSLRKASSLSEIKRKSAPSDDDKNELITLLYTTMDKVNPYDVPESDEIEAFVNEIPREALQLVWRWH